MNKQKQSGGEGWGLPEKRVAYIVEYLVRHLLHQGEPLGDGEQIIRQLVAQGYQLSEIQAAFAWIFQEQDIIDAEPPKDRIYQGIRVFSPGEERLFSPRCREKMLRLLAEGYINQAEMEEIILAGSKTTLSEIDLKEFVVLLKQVIPDSKRLALLLPVVGGEQPQLLH